MTAGELAEKGYATVETEVWELDPERPGGYMRLVRTKTVREVCKELADALGRGEYGDSPPGSEGLHCFFDIDGGDEPWPPGRIEVFSVRGGSEGDYVHVEVQHRDFYSPDARLGQSHLLLLCKTFEGRDAAWKIARDIADLLGA